MGVTEENRTSTTEQVNSDKHATHSLDLDDFFIPRATGGGVGDG